MKHVKLFEDFVNEGKVNRKKLSDDLWDRKGYDYKYLDKLSDKKLKSLWDTEFYYESANEGMLDMMVAVKDLARKMAKDYAKEASQFVLDGAVINDPERDAEMSLSKMSKELQLMKALKTLLRNGPRKLIRFHCTVQF
jgi:hypothetical protein